MEWCCEWEIASSHAGYGILKGILVKKADRGSIRTVLVVEAVYFLPEKRQHADDAGYTAIVVQEREMTEEEWALL